MIMGGAEDGIRTHTRLPSTVFEIMDDDTSPVGYGGTLRFGMPPQWHRADDDCAESVQPYDREVAGEDGLGRPGTRVGAPELGELDLRLLGVSVTQAHLTRGVLEQRPHCVACEL